MLIEISLDSWKLHLLKRPPSEPPQVSKAVVARNPVCKSPELHRPLLLLHRRRKETLKRAGISSISHHLLPRLWLPRQVLRRLVQVCTSLPMPSRPVAVSEPNPCLCRCRTTRRLPYLSSVLGLSSRSLPSPHQPNGSWLQEFPCHNLDRVWTLPLTETSVTDKPAIFSTLLAAPQRTLSGFRHDQRTVILGQIHQDDSHPILQGHTPSSPLITLAFPQKASTGRPDCLISHGLYSGFFCSDSRAQAIIHHSDPSTRICYCSRTLSCRSWQPYDDLIPSSNFTYATGPSWLCGNQALNSSTSSGRRSR